MLGPIRQKFQLKAYFCTAMLTLHLANLAISCDLLHPSDLPEREFSSLSIRVFHGKDMWASVALMDVAAGRHHKDLVLIWSEVSEVA